MNERDKLIAKLIKERGGSREDYLNLLNKIAYHESGHTLNPKQKQIGGGPGRGKYQFEIGKNRGGITAARRAKTYYEETNTPVPEWLKNATSTNDLDVSNLSSEQQDILFLANIRKHPKANFSNLWDGKETIQDFWANYHWAGDIKDRNKRINSFNSSINKYEKEYKNKIVNNTIKQPINTSSPMEYILSTMHSTNNKAYGGSFPSSVYKNEFNSFNTGGLHEENKYGGIPQGIGSNGKLNTVEEGETSFNFDDGKYIFSNRLS